MQHANKPAGGDKLTRALNVDYREEDKIWLTNSATLRKLIGILGMALPLLLWLFLIVASDYSTTLESISHYYYTRANSVFVIVISLMAIFLIVYRGKDPIDFYLSFIAGIFALCVLIFPTSNITKSCCDPLCNYSVTFITPSDLRHHFHYASAAIFLGCLAYMSIFVFTRSNVADKKYQGKAKRTRNTIYVVCGIIMIIAMAIIFAGFLGWIPKDFYDSHHLTFWMETVAVESFGFSWLIKGETLFKD